MKHNLIKMQHEDRRITDKKILEEILNIHKVVRLAFVDEPYPYIVPMNYGYTWENGQLIMYFHMAPGGYREKLIKKNPHVAINISSFIDRFGYQRVKNKDHDYRSINIFGTAKIITVEQENLFLEGLNAMNTHQRGLPPLKQIAPKWKDTLRVLQITAEEITGKAQYHLDTIEDVIMVENKLKGENV